MNQFTFTLKDNTQKAFNSFFWFLYFLHLIAAFVIVINTKDKFQNNCAIAAIVVFIVLIALYYLLKNKISLYYFQLAVFAVMILFWLLQMAWLAAIIMLAIIAFSFFVLKRKSTAIFNKETVAIVRSLLKKTYQWKDIENVVLKDNLLSIDLKNNHLIQVEIAAESYSVDETSFNQFCSQLLSS
ncbi:MAG: hypothetical protein WDM90_24805 [Ferruginibacter sp.]